MSTPRILCLALRSSGPNAAIHSVVDVGARFHSGPRAGEEFQGECTLFPGAVWDDRAEDLAGLNPRRFTQDTYSDTEAEMIDRLCAWIGAAEVMLAGFRPGPVRSFAAAAWARARGQRIAYSPPRLTVLSVRPLELHSLYVGDQLRRGESVPSNGFHPSEICHALGFPSISLRDPAIVTARRESEILTALLKA